MGFVWLFFCLISVMWFSCLSQLYWEIWKGLYSFSVYIDVVEIHNCWLYLGWRTLFIANILLQKFLSRFVIAASSLCELKENEQREVTVCCSFSTIQILDKLPVSSKMLAFYSALEWSLTFFPSVIRLTAGSMALGTQEKRLPPSALTTATGQLILKIRSMHLRKW